MNMLYVDGEEPKNADSSKQSSLSPLVMLDWCIFEEGHCTRRLRRYSFPGESGIGIRQETTETNPILPLYIAAILVDNLELTKLW
jgi:hypothetical protein